MNPVKTLINETKSFPPYHQTIDSLNMNLNSEKKIMEGLSSFLDQDLSILSKNQPKELQTCIEEIQKAGQKQIEIINQMISNQSKIPNTMSILDSLYTEIKNELSIISNARDVATDSQLIMDKSIQNLKHLKAQKSVDPSKLEEANQEVLKTTHQYDNDFQNANNVQKERSPNISKLRKKFVDSLSNSLKLLSQVKESAAKEMHQISTELMNSILLLEQSDEPNLTSLEDRLKQLEDEKIE